MGQHGRHTQYQKGFRKSLLNAKRGAAYAVEVAGVDVLPTCVILMQFFRCAYPNVNEEAKRDTKNSIYNCSTDEEICCNNVNRRIPSQSVRQISEVLLFSGTGSSSAFTRGHAVLLFTDVCFTRTPFNLQLMNY